MKRNIFHPILLIATHARFVLLFCFFLLHGDVGWSQVVEPECHNNAPCQLNPFWNFEMFENQNEVGMTLTLSTFPAQGDNAIRFGTGAGQNSPDFYDENTPNGLIDAPCDGNAEIETGNSTSRIRLISYITQLGLEFTEGVAFKLCNPIFPGMQGQIEFDATSSNACLILGKNPSARVFF